jgi:very-short-patch-repair endonuclease
MVMHKIMNAPGGQHVRRDNYDGERERWVEGANVKFTMCDGG